MQAKYVIIFNCFHEIKCEYEKLIDAQNNYLQSQLASETANYSFLLSIIQLERSLGYFFLMHTAEENEDFINRMNQFIFTK